MANAKRSGWLGFILLLAFSVSLSAGQQPAAGSSLPQTLHLLVNRSLVITSPVRITRISVANPSIAEAIVISPYQVLINGKTPGAVTMILWGANGETETFNLYVDVDVLALSQKIHDVFPSEHVQIEASEGIVMLTGQASSAAVANRIYQLVSAEVPKVISLVQVPTAPTRGEVLLQVKIAEIDLSAMHEFGFNFATQPNPTTRTLGVIQTQQFGGFNASIGGSGGGGTITPGQLLNLFIFRPDLGMGITIQALENKSLLQILAEPNLLTETGKEASFLAGGEFPYPVVQGGGAGSTPTVSIEFKQFGVNLHFTPTLTADGMIDLKVNPEVSSLDYAHALEVSGFLVPAISTRQVSTEMVLKNNQTFAIAGLLNNQVQKTLDKIPWIGDVPILGKLFRSNQLQKSRSDLLVLVTPHIVTPYGPGKAPSGPKFPVPFMKTPATPPPLDQPGK